MGLMGILGRKRPFSGMTPLAISVLHVGTDLMASPTPSCSVQKVPNRPGNEAAHEDIHR